MIPAAGANPSVQFFREFPVDKMSACAADGLAHGEAVLLVMSGSIRQGFLQELEKSGIDTTLAQARGQLVYWDADLLPQLAADGSETRLQPLLKDLTQRFERVRVFGFGEDHHGRADGGELQAIIEQQRQALANAKAEIEHMQRLSDLGELVAGLAHELNNPLSIIRSYLELLHATGKEFPQGPPSSFETYLSKADQAVQRMSCILENILHYARPAVHSHGEVDLAKVVERILDLMHEQISKSGIHVNAQLMPGAVVTGSETQLEQALFNLLANARDAVSDKFAGCGGEIWIQIKRSAESVELSVRDNGTGIPSDILPLIFDPFFSTKRPGRGTGLGLSITYGIVKEHRGTLLCKSEAGQGTTMLLTLPCISTM